MLWQMWTSVVESKKNTQHLPLKWQTLLYIKIKWGDEIYEEKKTSRGNKGQQMHLQHKA